MRAQIYAGFLEKILCPCKQCQNLSHQLVDEVHVHLVLYGMDTNYTTWFHHGKDPVQSHNDNVDLGAAYDLLRASEMYSTNIDNLHDKK